MKKLNLFLLMTCFFLTANTLQAQLQLDVDGDAKVSGEVTATKFVGDGSALTGISSPWTVNGANVSRSSGNVAIGKAAPTAKLDVLGDSKITGRLSVIGNSITLSESNQVLSLINNPASNYIQLNVGGSGHSADDIYLGNNIDDDNNNNNNNNRVLMMGSVGIGTPNPTQKLHVVGDGLFGRGTATQALTRNLTVSGARNASAEPFASLNFNNIDDDNGSMEYTGAKITSHNDDNSNNGDLRFFTNNGVLTSNLTQRMVIDGNGDVGIGVSNPGFKLDVNGIINGTSLNSTSLTIKGSGIIEDKLSIGRDFGSSYDLDIKQSAGGTSGIKLERSDNGNYWQFHIDPNDNLAYLYRGVLRAYLENGSGSFAITSDRRLKKNISAFETVLEKVMKLKPSQYYYKDANNPSRKSWGFVAQEVEAIFPEIVDTKDGYRALVYDDFAILSIKAIQEVAILVKEQEKENKSLQESISEQQTQINEQQQQIDELKSLVEKLLTKNEENPTGNNHELHLKKAPLLNQNQPNPFNENTLVEYFLPETAKNAYIQVTAVDGKILGTVNIQEKGQGQVTIKAAAYPAGTYYYSLIVDGQVFETKRMVLTK